MAVTLPTQKIKASNVDPRNLVIFGMPKLGKTTVLSTLDNCLILDFEKGTVYVDALKIEIDSFKTLKETLKAIKDNNCPYDFIAIDTITAMIDMLKPLALARYKASAAGSKQQDLTDILQAPFGAGYSELTNLIDDVINMIQSVTKHVIIAGHIKVSASEGGDADSLVKSLDAVGQIKRLIARNSDAIAVLERDADSNLVFNFITDSAECGARIKHLANQKIIVAERQENGEFVSHWDRIYQTLAL